MFFLYGIGIKLITFHRTIINVNTFKLIYYFLNPRFTLNRILIYVCEMVDTFGSACIKEKFSIPKKESFYNKSPW